jgi:alpha-ketoglutarate-dependent taurine dioxygenase
MSDTTTDRAALDITPLKDVTFGAVVRGVQLRSIDDETFAAIYDAWIDYALLIFPDQFLTTSEQDTFARRLGELEFKATPISNLGRDGTVHSDPDDDVVKSLRGNEGWHFDSTYMPVQAKGAVFSAEIVPAGGADTGWADMRAGYDALDDATKDHLADLEAYHSLYYSQGRSGYLPRKKEDGSYGMYGYHDLEPSLRPLVKYHPVTGRPNLLVGRHAYGIVGMDEDESVALLDKLVEDACQPPRVYHHKWTVGDAVLWDNRCLMHRGTPFDMTEPRRMWHTRIAGERSSELAANH